MSLNCHVSKVSINNMCMIYRLDVSILFCLAIFAILFTDGRGLRHKYFKDYKDYLGKRGLSGQPENLHYY